MIVYVYRVFDQSDGTGTQLEYTLEFAMIVGVINSWNSVWLWAWICVCISVQFLCMSYWARPIRIQPTEWRLLFFRISFICSFCWAILFKCGFHHHHISSFKNDHYRNISHSGLNTIYWWIDDMAMRQSENRFKAIEQKSSITRRRSEKRSKRKMVWFSVICWTIRYTSTPNTKTMRFNK